MDDSVRIPLDGHRAIAFHDAPRDDASPLPCCPQCGGDAVQVGWYEYEEWMEIDVDPCGHRFRVELPVVVKRTRDGWESWEEWHL
ncbi:hypothetical protein [Streptomyces sp. bgisy027]|uniref:hypothetical protein n=1 Tax=Streptomyces sp. bgisy027 TaxID=3413770 RepID=UPI003D728501